MADSATGSVADRITAIIRDAAAAVVADAREEGYRAGYADGRMEARREMNKRIQALLLDEGGDASVPQQSDAIGTPADPTSLQNIFDEMFGGLRQDTRAGVAPAQAGERPPAEAGGITPVKAAEGDEGEVQVPPAGEPAPQPIDEPAQAGGEAASVPAEASAEERPPAPPEPPTDETPAAVPAALPGGAGAEPGLNQPPPPPEPDEDEKEEAPPAPQPRPQAARPVWPADWRTDERKAAFIERYKRGDDMTEIRLALGDIVGPRMPDKNQPLWAWVTTLKLRRQTGGVSEPPPPPAPAPAPARERPPAIHPSIAPPGPRPDGTNPKAKVIPLPAPREDGRIYTSFYNIRAWAGVYGITYDGSNMDRVNKLREAKSLPPLVQSEG